MRQREPPAWAAETDGRALKGGRLSFYRRLGPEQIAKAASARSNGCSQSTRPAGCNAARSTPTSPTLSSPKPAATRSPPSPDALLHDHLDGGLRPETVIELAADVGYRELPTGDPAELGHWFMRGADRKSLELYLEGFRHTIALLQTRDAIERVAAECAEDLAADNVVYAEVRYAPELSTEGGLTLDEVVAANLAGFREGERRAQAGGLRIVTKMIVSAMRQAARSVEI